ncbi:Nif3-like dinuclear metal center hexameric protein [Membranicola marinus]|uniref:GTP cyclohydrolase 1 type 2 homolog n=1 Tax=Membranihabitans marinus TaxID=1227546 RepID=A0A953HMT8_9BACT|nr:Nif3-like dinuclear metal center hexameric protein [Membranihabitans marinus]MBY5958522.1 Nif3-like dinuclear metal center hexameric protein [Membranihabitans marinus]
MTKVKTVADFLENIAPLELQEDYDNSGLITGSFSWNVTGVLCALDCTPEVVMEAREEGCNLIVCHHPIIFQGLKKLSGDSYIVRAVVMAIRHDIAIYAIHTNLDNVLRHGVNERIAQRLNLSNVRILAPKEGESKIGAGVVGNYPDPFSVIDFLGMVRDRFELEVIKYVPASSVQKVRTVAACGGSGSFLLQDAIQSGADAFITADFKYHQYFDAEDRIMILDIGHYESEKYTIQLLHELLSNNFRNFAAQITKVDTNPVRYFK